MPMSSQRSNLNKPAAAVLIGRDRGNVVEDVGDAWLSLMILTP
jgi:hypothetical protein